MLVIADARARDGGWRRHGRRATPRSAATTRRSRSRARTSSRRRCAATSKRLGLKTEASIRFERGGDIDAPPVGIARARGAARADRRRTAGRAARRSLYPAPRAPRRHAARGADRARCSGSTCRRPTCRGSSSRLGFDVRRRPATTRWTRDGAELPGRRRARSRSRSRRSAATTASIGSDDVPSARRRRSAPPTPRSCAERLVRQVLTAAGLLRGDDVRVHRARGGAPFCETASSRRRSPTRCRRSSRCCGRRCCPGWWTPARTTAAASAKDIRLFETGSRFTAAGEGRAVGVRVVLARPRAALVGADAGRGLLRHQGRRRAASAAPSASRPDVRARVDGRISARPRGGGLGARNGATDRSASSADRRRRSPPRAASRRPRRSSPPSSTSTRCAASVAAGDDLRARAAAAVPVDRARHLDPRRRSLACCRRSWHYPFGGAGDARLRSSSSIAIRARACRRAASACRCGSHSAPPDRTLTDDEAQARSTRSSTRARARARRGADARYATVDADLKWRNRVAKL